MIRWYFGFALLVLAFLAGVYITREYFKSAENRVVNETAVVIAEKFTDVMKLVAVEGHFSEIYTYEDYVGWRWFPLRKKALVRVDAKVSAGFDLESMCLVVDDDSRTVYLSEPPPASILSVDHNLQYYDITQGAFNVFSAADYNHINAKAKENIYIAALSDGTLLKKASLQMNHIIEGFESGLNSIGWNLELTPMEPALDEFYGPELVSAQSRKFGK